MRKNFILYVVLAVILASCQKEVDFGVPGGGGSGGGSANQKLVRVGTKSGADTTTTDYSYNSAGKLIRQYITGNASGISFFLETKINRNASGIITSIVLKSDQFVAIGIDSLVTIVKYNSSTSRYTGRVTTVTVFGITVTDSTVLTYDGTGRIIQQESYSANPISGLFEKSEKEVYTYLTGTNVGNEKFYEWDVASNSYILLEEYTNEYDSKINPLPLGMEAIFLGDLVGAAANNLTKSIYVDATDPSNNETSTVVYTYNSANKPQTSTSTLNSGGAVFTATYTYQ